MATIGTAAFAEPLRGAGAGARITTGPDTTKKLPQEQRLWLWKKSDV
jgi:hypothetical protein